jgi:hypothetical protein
MDRAVVLMSSRQPWTALKRTATLAAAQETKGYGVGFAIPTIGALVA